MFKKPKYPRGMRFFPTFVMEDVLVIFLFLAIFFTGVFFFPEWIISGDSEIPADPFSTPEHIKPEWYFLASYQFLKIIPSEFGALILLTLGLMVFVFLPFIDRTEDKPITQRPFFLLLVLLSIISFVGLTIWGEVS